jgi:hypothetical protein
MFGFARAKVFQVVILMLFAAYVSWGLLNGPSQKAFGSDCSATVRAVSSYEVIEFQPRLSAVKKTLDAVKEKKPLRSVLVRNREQRSSCSGNAEPPTSCSGK